MKILPAWLREFVPLNVDLGSQESVREFAERITMSGVAVEGISGSGDGTVFEMEITTNRVDAMNHYGIARECAAIFDLDLKPLEAQLPAAAASAPFPITIEDAEGCARYTGRVLRGVKIGPSPALVQCRFAALEQKPINSAADATNHNLIEMGHPTHAFDLDTLRGGRIIVRRARAGEVLKTLDGVERKLTPEDLVIADAERPVALAGVMGGLDTMITERTRNVLIEAAWFDPLTIRRTARRFGMHTDASHRFERGADWGATRLAADRVAQLILEWAGGRLEGDAVDVVARKVGHAPVNLSRAEVLRILGKDIGEEEIARILSKLGFGVTRGRTTTVAPVAAGTPAGTGGARVAVAEEVADFRIEIPSWRLDVERDIDLIEEIARIYGYNRFANTLPQFAGAVHELPEAPKSAKLRSALLALGYNEALSPTFAEREETLAAEPAAEPVELENPLSEEAGVMRTSLVPGVLGMIERNLNRGQQDVRLFESGHVFALANGESLERDMLCFAATRSALAADAKEDALSTFRRFKGDVEALLALFDAPELAFSRDEKPNTFHPGRAARVTIGGAFVARFGQLRPELAAARKFRQEVFLAEFFLDRLFERELRVPRYRQLSRFPAVDRDLSFLFDEAVTFDRIENSVKALRLENLRSFRPVEIFRGGAVPAGRYSLLLRAEFQSPERTLTDDEVGLWTTQIVKALEVLGGALRA